MNRFAGRYHVGGENPSVASYPAPLLYDGCQVWFRGYIANVRMLIDESRRRGEALSEATDGHLFAKAFRWWGWDLETHVLGEYVVAVFETRSARLLFTHDSIGLVPGFYAQQADGWLFASHLEELLHLGGCPALDEEYIADYLASGMVISTRTPYAGLRRLAPGESLHVVNRRLRARQGWNLSAIRPLALPDEEAYQDRLTTLLDEGVNAALRSEGGVWSELSGGLDSSSVTSVAARARPRDLAALSIVYSSSRSADESKWMRMVVHQYDLPWHTIDADESRPFCELPESFCAEPIDVLTGAGLLRRYGQLASSHGVRVVLSGCGGDQVFSGDLPKPYYLADLLRTSPRQCVAALQAWRRHDSSKRSLSHHLMKSVLRPTLRYIAGRRVSEIDTVPPRWIRPEYVQSMRLAKRSQQRQSPRASSVAHQYLADKIWCLGFMIGSDDCPFDFRYPLLYRPLVEFMAAVPWNLRFRPGQDRYLQRSALKGILPEAIRCRTDKAGPTEAEIEGLRTGSPWTDMLLHQPRLVDRQYVDGARWQAAVHQARFGRIDSMRHFNAAVTLEVWLRQFERVQRQGLPGVTHRSGESDARVMRKP